MSIEMIAHRDYLMNLSRRADGMEYSYAQLPIGAICLKDFIQRIDD